MDAETVIFRSGAPARVSVETLAALEALASSEQAWRLQNATSVLLPPHAPPKSAGASTDRFLAWVPSPQLTEQGPEAPQAVQVQSTGQGFRLQFMVSLAEPSQVPPKAAKTTMLRLRSWLPMPQLCEQEPQLPHWPQEQFTAQEPRLQLAWLVRSPEQFAPPFAAGERMLRFLVMTPAPQGCEQLP